MSSQTLTAVLFLAVVALTVGITFWASRQGSGTTDFYAGGRNFSGFQNGMAVSGDYMSAASFLGISGLIALNGYDGFLYSIGFLVAWLVALLLDRRAAAQLGSIHDGGPAGVPDEAAPGAHGRGDLDGRRLDLLPARADGRRGCTRGTAPRRAVRDPQGADDRRRRRADDLLRHGRWHEGHDVGPDRQGGPADGRHRADHRAGARRVRVQPLRAARCRRPRRPARARRSSSPG